MRILVANITYNPDNDDYQVVSVHKEPHDSDPGTTTLTSSSLEDCLEYIKRKHNKQTQIEMCNVHKKKGEADDKQI